MLYTGTGSSSTPDVILNLMTEIGMAMGREGITLRTGGDLRSDVAFRIGAEYVSGERQIFLPPKQYLGTLDDFSSEYFCIGDRNTEAETALAWAKKVWDMRETPDQWNDLRILQRYKQACVSMELMGPTMSSPTQLVICWMDDHDRELEQLIKMAELISADPHIDYVIPVLNLKLKSNRDLITNMIKENGSLTGLITSLQDTVQRRYKKGLHR